MDETVVALRIGPCVLVARGEGLKLRQMTQEDGRAEIRGRLDGLSYESAPSPRRLHRMFG